MINVAHSKAALAAMPGDIIPLPRAQMAELLLEVEVGQQARRALTTLKTMIAIAASTSGAPA